MFFKPRKTISQAKAAKRLKQKKKEIESERERTTNATIQSAIGHTLPMAISNGQVNSM